MDGFQTDDEVEDDSGSDGEMGADAEDGDEAASSNLRKLADQVRVYSSEDPNNICLLDSYLYFLRMKLVFLSLGK